MRRPFSIVQWLSKRELRRWFAGRFVRDVRPTRDGSALLVASNLGVVRVQL
jgi:hypothetical protein